MRTRLDLFILSALAVYRVWRLLARDTITERWREEFYNRWPPSAERSAGVMQWNASLRESVFRVRAERERRPKVSWFAKALDCPWCSGAWLAAVATVAVDVCFGVVWPLAWFLALSTAVGLLGRAEGAETPARVAQ